MDRRAWQITVHRVTKRWTRLSIQLIYNVMLVSSVQQSDSAPHIHVSILFQILFPCRLLWNSQYSSPCYTVGPYWLFYIQQCVCPSQSHNLSLPPINFILLLLFLLFTYVFLVALGLCCCAQAFTSCGEQGRLTSGAALPCVVAEHRLQAHRLQQLQHAGSVVAAPGLQSTGSIVVVHGLSCSATCGIFLYPRMNPRLLHWQANSLPLSQVNEQLDLFLKMS